MAIKRIRCLCGKIYDSACLPVCPDCQTPPPTSAIPPITPSATLPEVPLEKMVMLDSDDKKRPWLYVQSPGKIVFGAGLFILCIGGWLVLRQPPKPNPPRGLSEEVVTPAAASEVVRPVSPADLASEIAKSGPGATIRLAAGTYRGGFPIGRPIQLIGDSANGPVTIQCENLGPLRILAAGVRIQNIQFTGNPGKDMACIEVLDHATLDLRKCILQSPARFGVYLLGTSVFSASQCTFSTEGRGTGCQMENASRAELNDCLFKDNRWGWTLRDSAQGNMVRCQFEKNGLPDQNSYSIGVTGEATLAKIEQCTFTNNPHGVIANDRGHLTLKGCQFNGNGVTNAPTHVSFGSVNANHGGQILVSDCTFDSNLQGLAVESGAYAKVENCTFTETGLPKASNALLLTCAAISSYGEGSKVSVFKVKILRSLQNGINLAQGAVLEMEDCDVNDGQALGLGVGFDDKRHSEVTATNCRFNGNRESGIGIVPDSVVKVSNSTISHNRLHGIFLTGDQATLTAEKSEISQNGECGLLVLNKAIAVLDTCNIQENVYGAQTGTSKGRDGGGVFLNACTIAGSRGFGAGSFDGTLTVNNCTFANNQKNYYRGKGLILEESSKNTTLPSEQRTGMEPTSNTTPQQEGSDAKKSTRPVSPTKKSATPRRTPPPRNKAEEIFREVQRYLPH